MGLHQRIQPDGNEIMRRKDKHLIEKLSELEDLETYESAAL